MREHLYKAKLIDGGKWVQGYLYRFWDHAYILWGATCPGAFGADIAPSMKEVDPERDCEYTGIPDKSGSKIFENDICRYRNSIVRILWSKKHQWGAEILESNSALSKGLIFPLWQYGNCEENGNRELEVIGNIFDNPELLEEGKL